MWMETAMILLWYITLKFTLRNHEKKKKTSDKCRRYQGRYLNPARLDEAGTLLIWTLNWMTSLESIDACVVLQQLTSCTVWISAEDYVKTFQYNFNIKGRKLSFDLSWSTYHWHSCWGTWKKPYARRHSNLNPSQDDPFNAQLLLYAPLRVAFGNRTFRSQTAPVFCIRFWEQTISSLQGTNWFVFTMKMFSVRFEMNLQIQFMLIRWLDASVSPW
jgi:hypothetical protein